MKDKEDIQAWLKKLQVHCNEYVQHANEAKTYQARHFAEIGVHQMLAIIRNLEWVIEVKDNDVFKSDKLNPIDLSYSYYEPKPFNP